MTQTQLLLMILVSAVCTLLTRAVPFLLFGNRPIPPLVQYLGRTLPPAVIALLVVYCLRNVDWLAARHGLNELAAIAVTVALHLWKRNYLLSIGAGTALYMFLV